MEAITKNLSVNEDKSSLAFQVQGDQRQSVDAVPSEFEDIRQEWVETCKDAMDACPFEFMVKFSNVMFTGMRLLTETRVRAEVNAAKEAVQL